MKASYTVEIEVLTPTHIGCGKTLSGIDYFCYDAPLSPPYKKNHIGKDITTTAYLYKFSINDFVDVLDRNDKELYSKLLESGVDTFEVRNFFYKKLELEKSKYQSKFFDIAKEKIQISNSFYHNWKEKIIGKPRQSQGKTYEKRQAEFQNQLSQLQIQSFVSSLGRYYIPGSSLKGAIRTILTTTEIEKCKNVEKDPFKKLIVRDSEFVTEGLEIGKIGRQSVQGEGTYAEFLKPRTKVQTQIILRDFIDESALLKVTLSKEQILSKANSYTKNKISSYLEELKQLKEHPDLKKGDSGSIKKLMKLQSVQNSFQSMLLALETLDENECIINLGFGGGYWLKSFEGNEKHPTAFRIKHLVDPNINIPRTSWNIDLENLGFVKLKFL